MDNTNISDKSFTYELPLNILCQPNESTACQALWSIADRLDLGHSILNLSLLSKLFSLILCHTNKASTSQVLRICLCLDWQCHFCRLPARGPLTFHEDQPHWNQPHCRHLHCCIFASPMSHFSLFLHSCVLQVSAALFHQLQLRSTGLPMWGIREEGPDHSQQMKRVYYPMERTHYPMERTHSYWNRNRSKLTY